MANKIVTAFSYVKSRFVNIGVGTGNSVFIPNHTLPRQTLRAQGKPILTWVRAIGQSPVYYGLSLANVPAQGPGVPTGSVDFTPLQQSLAVPLGNQIVPGGRLSTTPEF